MKYLIIFFLIAQNYFSYSQEKQSDFQYQKLALGVSPSSFINLYEGVQISFDIGLAKNLNLSLETAYIYKSPLRHKSQGYRIKTGFEYAYKTRPNYAFNFGLFLINRNVFEHRRFQVSHFEERYIEYIPVIRNKNLIGAEFTMGYINKITSNIYFELGYGLGKGNLYVEDDIDVSSNSFTWFGFSNYDSVGKWNYPIVSINFSIFYQLFHFKDSNKQTRNISSNKIIK